MSLQRLKQDDYRFELHDYEKMASGLAILGKKVRNHITMPNQDTIAGCTTLWEVLRRLQDRCKPTDEATLMELKHRWNVLTNMEAKTQD